MLAIGLLSILPKSGVCSEKVLLGTQETLAICKGNVLIFANDQLLEYSGNKFTIVEKYFSNEIQCKENQDYINLILMNSKFFATTVVFQSYQDKRYLNYSESCTENDCSIDVQHIKKNILNMNFLGFNFSNSDEEFLFEETVHWQSQSCPPWHPDCDL